MAGFIIDTMTNSRLGGRRAQAQADSIGGEIKIGRGEHGLTRAHAARRAGVSPDTQRRVEEGDPGVSLATLCAVGEAAGLEVVVRGYRGRGHSLRDTGQMTIVELVCALAHPSWQADLEVRAGDHGEACDIGFYGPMEIINAEVERMILDFQAMHRRNARKRAYLAARHQRPVRLVIILEDTQRNRTAMALHASLISTAYPAASREVLHALRTGEPLRRDGLLWIRRRKPPHPR